MKLKHKWVNITFKLNYDPYGVFDDSYKNYYFKVSKKRLRQDTASYIKWAQGRQDADPSIIGYKLSVDSYPIGHSPLSVLKHEHVKRLMEYAQESWKRLLGERGEP